MRDGNRPEQPAIALLQNHLHSVLFSLNRLRVFDSVHRHADQDRTFFTFRGDELSVNITIYDSRLTTYFDMKACALPVKMQAGGECLLALIHITRGAAAGKPKISFIVHSQGS